MNKLIRFIKKLPFTIAALGLWGFSAGFNAKFGIKMGGDDLSSIALWVTMSVCLDVMKAYAGMILRQSLGARDLMKIALSVGMLLAGTTYSLFSAFSLRTMTAATEAAKRNKIIEQRKATNLRIEQNRVRAANLTARNITKIEAELATKRNNSRYRTSSQCTDATIAASIKLCNNIAALEGERTRAIERAYREKKIEDDEKALAAMVMPTSSANPMAQSLASLLTLMEIEEDATRLNDIIMAAITLLAEFASVAGPMLAAADKRPSAPRTRRQWSRRKEHTPAPETPADGRKLERDEALAWLTRAHQDERVKCDGDTITATNKALAQIWGRPASTVNDWLNVWASEGKIEKRAGAKGTRIKVCA